MSNSDDVTSGGVTSGDVKSDDVKSDDVKSHGGNSDDVNSDDVTPIKRFRRTIDWLERTHYSSHKDLPNIDELIARHEFVQRVRQTVLEPGDPLLARSVIENV